MFAQDPRDIKLEFVRLKTASNWEKLYTFAEQHLENPNIQIQNLALQNVRLAITNGSKQRGLSVQERSIWNDRNSRINLGCMIKCVRRVGAMRQYIPSPLATIGSYAWVPFSAVGSLARAAAGYAHSKYTQLQAFRAPSVAEQNFILGSQCFIGHGVAQDKKRAIKHFRIAAEAGHPKAQYWLAGCYIDGIEVKPDKKTALHWMELAAAGGDPEAIAALPALRRNPQQILQALQQAAEQKDPAALCNLGTYHQYGQGRLSVDLQTARACYQEAAELGDAVAQSNLGHFYKLGRGGIAKNLQSAMAWYQKSAEGGYVWGQYNLAHCYVQNNQYREAATWYQMAADQGFLRAKIRLIRDCYCVKFGAYNRERGQGAVSFNEARIPCEPRQIEQLMQDIVRCKKTPEDLRYLQQLGLTGGFTFANSIQDASDGGGPSRFSQAPPWHPASFREFPEESVRQGPKVKRTGVADSEFEEQVPPPPLPDTTTWRVGLTNGAQHYSLLFISGVPPVHHFPVYKIQNVEPIHLYTAINPIAYTEIGGEQSVLGRLFTELAERAKKARAIDDEGLKFLTHVVVNNRNFTIWELKQKHKGCSEDRLLGFTTEGLIEFYVHCDKHSRLKHCIEKKLIPIIKAYVDEQTRLASAEAKD